MDRQTIIVKQKVADARYKQLQDEVTTKQTEIETINTELVKLQGEYRAYDALLEEDPSKVIDVEPTLAKEDSNAKSE